MSMTLGRWSLLLPAIEMIVIAAMILRIHYRRYVMLIIMLLLDACANVTTFLAFRHGKPSWATIWVLSQPARMVVRTAVVIEIFKLACVEMTTKERWEAIWSALIATLICWTVVAWSVQLTVLQSAVIFRQFYHLMLVVAVLVLAIQVHRNPVCENSDSYTYRVVVSWMLVRIFLGSCFVKGGIGYVVFPYNDVTWRVVDITSWALQMLMVVVLGWGMTSGISTLRPEVAKRVQARQRRRNQQARTATA